MKRRLLAGALCLLVGSAILAWMNRPRYGLEDLLGPDQLAASQWCDEGSGPAVALLLRGLEHPDARIRARCLVSLDRLGQHDSLTPVIARLRDPDVNVRAIAARTVGRQRGWESPSPLLACLREPGQDSRVRTYLLEALSRSQVAAVVPDLLRSAGNRSASLSERTTAIQGLMRMRIAEAAPLLTVLLNDPEEPPRLRWRAGVALGRCQQFDVLLDFLRRGGGRAAADERALAGVCLGFLGAPPAVSETVRPLLQDLVRNAATPHRARISAARVLHMQRVPVDDAFLGELLLHDQDKEVRRLAAETIACSGHEELFDCLFEAQEKERSREVRHAIATAIGRLP